MIKMSQNTNVMPHTMQRERDVNTRAYLSMARFGSLISTVLSKLLVMLVARETRGRVSRRLTVSYRISG